ncbi:hypothetical protein KKA27_03470 [Patescibacteria group bacterium]|nr:hypothetical protein [Patescibacteria group bacterium]
MEEGNFVVGLIVALILGIWIGISFSKTEGESSGYWFATANQCSTDLGQANSDLDQANSNLDRANADLEQITWEYEDYKGHTKDMLNCFDDGYSDWVDCINDNSYSLW